MVDLDAENVDVAVRIGKPADSSLHPPSAHQPLAAGRLPRLSGPPWRTRPSRRAGPPQLPHSRPWAPAPALVLPAGHGAREGGGAGQPASVGGTPLLCAALAGAALLLSSWMVQQSIDEGTLLPLLPEWLASPTRIARTRSTRCFVAAASSNPRPAPSSTFWSRRSGPARAALTATGPPGETLKTQTPGTGPGVGRGRHGDRSA
jgi:hypothetical protein